jgi:hypothetical protein
MIEQIIGQETNICMKQCCGSGSESNVFEPPGSVIILYGPGSFHQQEKKIRKTLISTIDFFDCLSMKTDVNVRSKSGNKQKT